jgi:hypothetical protein
MTTIKDPFGRELSVCAHCSASARTRTHEMPLQPKARPVVIRGSIAVREYEVYKHRKRADAPGSEELPLRVTVESVPGRFCETRTLDSRDGARTFTDTWVQECAVHIPECTDSHIAELLHCTFTLPPDSTLMRSDKVPVAGVILHVFPDDNGDVFHFALARRPWGRTLHFRMKHRKTWSAIGESGIVPPCAQEVPPETLDQKKAEVESSDTETVDDAENWFNAFTRQWEPIAGAEERMLAWVTKIVRTTNTGTPMWPQDDFIEALHGKWLWSFQRDGDPSKALSVLMDVKGMPTFGGRCFWEMAVDAWKRSAIDSFDPSRIFAKKTVEVESASTTNASASGDDNGDDFVQVEKETPTIVEAKTPTPEPELGSYEHPHEISAQWDPVQNFATLRDGITTTWTQKFLMEYPHKKGWFRASVPTDGTLNLAQQRLVLGYKVCYDGKVLSLMWYNKLEAPGTTRMSRTFNHVRRPVEANAPTPVEPAKPELAPEKAENLVYWQRMPTVDMQPSGIAPNFKPLTNEAIAPALFAPAPEPVEPAEPEKKDESLTTNAETILPPRAGTFNDPYVFEAKWGPVEHFGTHEIDGSATWTQDLIIDCHFPQGWTRVSSPPSATLQSYYARAGIILFGKHHYAQCRDGKTVTLMLSSDGLTRVQIRHRFYHELSAQ